MAKYAAKNAARALLGRGLGARAGTVWNIRTIGTVVGSIIAPIITTHAPTNAVSSNGNGSGDFSITVSWSATLIPPTMIRPTISSQHTPAVAHKIVPGSRRSRAAVAKVTDMVPS